MNRLYMYRITNEQGTKNYKVDFFSRKQVGRGGTNPGGAHYGGSLRGLTIHVSLSRGKDGAAVTPRSAQARPLKCSGSRKIILSVKLDCSCAKRNLLNQPKE